MKPYVPKKGDFVAVSFDPQSGHEQKGSRPALVVSNTLFNEQTGLAMVCPLTTTDRRYPFHVAVANDPHITGFVMVEQVKSIVQERQYAFNKSPHVHNHFFDFLAAYYPLFFLLDGKGCLPILSPMLDALRREVALLANPEKAKVLQRFFKTGPGQYGEGDVFLGIVVPVSRKIAKKYAGLALDGVLTLLKSRIHEERLIALFILITQFEKGNTRKKEEIFRLYLKHTASINNWDLVDLSAEKIVGAYLEERPKEILYDLARSESIWERRIAIIATFHSIKAGKCEDTLAIAGILLRDREDLIHKAIGWMLREVGKRCSEEVEEAFLRKHFREMPRTMLRYAIERFNPEKKRLYLIKKKFFFPVSIFADKPQKSAGDKSKNLY